MVEGYGAEYLGVLESNSDGLGVWSADAFTLVTCVLWRGHTPPARDGGGTDARSSFVGNPTFHAFARLMAGDYGSRPLDPEHTMVLVNPYFTAPRDIGQPWDRRLREEADAIINGRQWDWIYCVRPCRGSRSEFGRPARRGVLALEYPGEWALWESDGGEGDQRGGYEVLADALVLAGGRDRPTDAEVVRALDGVPPASIIPPKPWRD